jgi:hypothetical protein
VDFVAPRRDPRSYEREPARARPVAERRVVVVRRRAVDGRDVLRLVPALRLVAVRRARVAVRLLRALTLAPAFLVLEEARRVTWWPRFSAASTAFAARFRTISNVLVTSSTAALSFSIAASTVPTAAYATSFVCGMLIPPLDYPYRPPRSPLCETPF